MLTTSNRTPIELYDLEKLAELPFAKDIFQAAANPTLVRGVFQGPGKFSKALG